MTSTEQAEEGHRLDGARFTTVWQAEVVARALSWVEDGEAFVRACVQTPAGREFLGSEEWSAIQRKLVDQAYAERQTHPADDYVDGAEAWDGFVDEMAQLPTVKMAHEFLCRLQADGLGREFLASPIWRRWVRARFPELDPVSGLIGDEPRQPQVGDDVLYVSYGTPGGEFGREERTARVTEAGAWVEVEVTGADRPAPGALRRVVEVWAPLAVQLFVMNPGGTFHAGPVEYDAGRLVDERAKAVDSILVVPEVIGDRRYDGGTWHWPEPPAAPSPMQVALDPEAQQRAERLAAGHCPDHGDQCASWVMTVGGGGTHVGPPRWKL